MAGFVLQTSVLAAVLLAVALQMVLKEPVSLGLGLGKTFQPLSDFPYSCRRIESPQLQACEDMWLSESTRQLFLACSDPLARQRWMPNAYHFNISGRSTRDAVVAVDIDAPKGDGFELRALKTPGFSGTAGDGLLQLVGFAGSDAKDGTVELLLVNNRPPIDPATGKLLEKASGGANSTIELFRTGPAATEMEHVRTWANANISTPNRIVHTSSDSFYFTNDHGDAKTGLKFFLGPLMGSGDVSYCSGTQCRRVSTFHRMPNGLVQGHDGLLYVPSSMTGAIQVYRTRQGTGELSKVANVSIPYAIDNLSVDANGDIWAAVFPRGIEILQASKDPLNARVKSAVIRIRRRVGDEPYEWEKVIEDGEAEVLPGSTTVVHDAKTGRLFFSGVNSPFIAVCEPKK
ncbi:serum paraoxonase arylesterase [Colletotrichum musicola]|uniref:Serum paraoxonase arylesterase n=1 Tax=Colletotrichum musicola TaxID=2175873 RepID=A0A8H6NZ63_9PEZI|nr:serum paraoxonase arylesterase [Colletotrichum musicola]